jgi:pimeloyl-ACP methyl ester carboxylesterase
MKDPTFGEKYLNKWWHEFPLAEVERLDDAGHLLMEEKPVETLRTIRRFLSAVPKPGGFLA